MNAPLNYYIIDRSVDISYPEQRIALRQESRHKFLVSMSILDPSFCFDPAKSYIDNVTAVCTKDMRRAKLQSASQNPFKSAWVAGTRNLYDARVANGEDIPFLCFDTVIDLKKNDKDPDDRIEPMRIERRPIRVYGSYGFKDFSDVDINTAAEKETLRLDTAKSFARQLEDIPPLWGLCESHLNQTDSLYLGDVLSAAAGHILKRSAANLCDREKIAALGYSGSARENTKTCLTLQEYKNMKGKLCSVRLTAPLGDPIAAYNLLQFKKILDKKPVEGSNQAARAAKFINEQTQKFTL